MTIYDRCLQASWNICSVQLDKPMSWWAASLGIANPVRLQPPAVARVFQPHPDRDYIRLWHLRLLILHFSKISRFLYIFFGSDQSTPSILLQMDNWDYSQCLGRLKYRPKQNNCFELRQYEVVIWYANAEGDLRKTNLWQRIEQRFEMVLLTPKNWSSGFVKYIL